MVALQLVYPHAQVLGLIDAATYKSLQGRSGVAPGILNHAALVCVLTSCGFTNLEQDNTVLVELTVGNATDRMELSCDAVITAFGWSSVTFRKRLRLYTGAAMLARAPPMWTNAGMLTSLPTEMSCIYLNSADATIGAALCQVWGDRGLLATCNIGIIELQPHHLPPAIVELSFRKFESSVSHMLKE